MCFLNLPKHFIFCLGSHWKAWLARNAGSWWSSGEFLCKRSVCREKNKQKKNLSLPISYITENPHLQTSTCKIAPNTLKTYWHNYLTKIYAWCNSFPQLCKSGSGPPTHRRMHANTRFPTSAQMPLKTPALMTDVPPKAPGGTWERQRQQRLWDMNDGSKRKRKRMYKKRGIWLKKKKKRRDRHIRL